MKRIFSLILVTTLLLSLGMLIARRIGAAQPPPSFALLFTNPDGTPCQMPCVFGIRPGITTKKQAFALIQAHPLTRNMTKQTESLNTTGFSYAFDLHLTFSDENQVLRIQLTALLGLTLGEVIARLREPESINIDKARTTGQLFYYVSSFRVIYSLRWIRVGIREHAEERLSPESELVGLDVRTQGFQDGATYPTRNWLGFGSITRYFPLTP
jgi:hypothetical protein